MWNRSCSIVVAVLIVAALLGTSIAASACVGARPLAMGGAFVGLADDINATYWNPAGLAQLGRTETTWMHTATNRDEINYQDYGAVAGPLRGVASVGLSWVRSNMVLGTELDSQDWYWASVAAKMGPNAGVGINIKKIRNSLPGVDTDMAFDIGLHGNLSDKWSLGLLVQNANTPDIEFDGEAIGIWSRNWRPGAAYRPDDSSVMTLELYDATDDADARSLRVGYEKILRRGWAARLGYYGLGASSSDAVTFGVGKRNAGRRGDEVTSSDFDVAVMIGDVDAVLASVSFRL